VSTSIRNAGVIEAADSESVTVHDPVTGTSFRVEQGPALHFWLIQPGVKRSCRFTSEPEIGETVSFMTMGDLPVASWSSHSNKGVNDNE
jgi:hypothetical protein